MERGSGRRKGQMANCIRCGKPFIRNYEDHIVCEPGCSDTGEPNDDARDDKWTMTGAKIPATPCKLIFWQTRGRP